MLQMKRTHRQLIALTVLLVVTMVWAWLGAKALQAADEELGRGRQQAQVKHIAIERARSALETSGRSLIDNEAVQEEFASAQEQLAKSMFGLYQAYSELGALSREEYGHLAELRVFAATYRAAAIRAMVHGAAPEAGEARSLLIRSARDASSPLADSLQGLQDASNATMLKIDSAMAERSRHARAIVGTAIGVFLLLLLGSSARMLRSPLLQG